MVAAAESVLSEDAAFLHAQQSIGFAPSTDPIALDLLRSTFVSIWKQVLCEMNNAGSASRPACEAAAEAVLALAQAGLQPEHIRRLALSRARHALATFACAA
jgi:hypothetical protein